MSASLLDLFNETSKQGVLEDARLRVEQAEGDAAFREKLRAIAIMARTDGWKLFMQQMESTAREALRRSTQESNQFVAAKALGELNMCLLVRQWAEAHLSLVAGE